MAGAAVLVLVSGCGATAPSRPAGAEFRLESIAGAPIPAALSGAIVVVSGSLSLHPDGTVIAATATRNLTQGDPDTEQTSHSTGSWSTARDRLTLTMPHGTLRFRVEEGGDLLRSEEMSTTGPGLAVYREYVYRRQR